MFKQAVIYYPTDEKVLRQIYKDIATYHCAAVIAYMDSLNLNDEQKVMLIDSITHDLAGNQQVSA